MISQFEEVKRLFEEMESHLENTGTDINNLHLFVIGGAVLLYHGLKPATKDIDIIVESKKEYFTFQKLLKSIDFKPKIPGLEYRHMNLTQIFERDDFRIDVFHKTVCNEFSLSKAMIKRAIQIQTHEKLKISLCSNEDIFLFKTMTEREGDLEDCIALVQKGIEWNVILTELKSQIKHSGKEIWITWVGERMDILVEKGLNISIMKEIDTLREDYFNELEKKNKYTKSD